MFTSVRDMLARSESMPPPATIRPAERYRARDKHHSRLRLYRPKAQRDRLVGSNHKPRSIVHVSNVCMMRPALDQDRIQARRRPIVGAGAVVRPSLHTPLFTTGAQVSRLLRQQWNPCSIALCRRAVAEQRTPFAFTTFQRRGLTHKKEKTFLQFTDALRCARRSDENGNACL